MPPGVASLNRATSFPISRTKKGSSRIVRTTARAKAARVSSRASRMYRATMPPCCSPSRRRVAISLARKPIWATVSEM